MDCNKKLLVFNSDDFGMSTAFNEAVKDGFLNGFLTSTCICANGEAFETAVKEVLPQCDGLGLGVHLNIIEGKTLRRTSARTSILCNPDGTYNRGFVNLLFNSNNKRLLTEVEAEFRNQIEEVLKYAKPDHLNSHVHTHAIPAIFEITCKLAKEYGIHFVRTQAEKPYFTSIVKTLDTKYPVNLIKVWLLNTLTTQNLYIARDYGIETNDYIIGVGYTGYMDSSTIKSGLRTIKNSANLAEIIIHPCKYSKGNVAKKTNYAEYLSTKDDSLLEQIKRQGWVLTNYKEMTFTNN